jgi:hypothetical protein
MVTRKLKVAGQALDSIIIKKDLAQFLNGIESGQKLNDLVEDIRDALMGYQVCTPKPLVLVASNNVPGLVTARFLQQELPNDCRSCSPTTWWHIVTCNRGLRTAIFCRTCTTPLKLGIALGTGRDA